MTPEAMAATVPDPLPRPPLVDRVAALESALADLIDRHNAFAGDVSHELGL